jgi:hypothetical protein
MKRNYVCATCGRKNTFDTKKGTKRVELQESRAHRGTPVVAFIQTCRFCHNENVIPARNSMPTKSQVRRDFWNSKSLDQLAAEQGVKPVENPDDLKGDFWPEDESIDDFLVWLRALRREGKERR